MTESTPCRFLLRYFAQQLAGPGVRRRCVLPVATSDRSSSRRSWQEDPASHVTFCGLSEGAERVKRGHAGNEMAEYAAAAMDRREGIATLTGSG